MVQASHNYAAASGLSGSRFTVLLANEAEGWHQTVRRLLEPQGVQTLSAQTSIQYVYDALGRLRAVTDPNGDTATYTYDAWAISCRSRATVPPRCR